MKIPFYKYQGAGNDFVIVDQRSETYLSLRDHSAIERICDRRFGVGADGLIFLQNHPECDFEMVYFNADGKTSSMCGNGGRCIVSLAHKLGVIQPHCTFIAIDGIHEATIFMEGLVSLKMNDVSEIQSNGYGFILDTGSPHCVLESTDLEELDVVREAKKIRYSDSYREKGINVNFVEKRDSVLHVRTYERGVEDETLACGTGVTAAALVSALDDADTTEGTKDIRARGGKLSVSFEKKGQTFSNIWLTGPAVYVFEGYYFA